MLILDNLLIYAIFATMSDIIQLLPDALANQIAAGGNTKTRQRCKGVDGECH